MGELLRILFVSVFACLLVAQESRCEGEVSAEISEESGIRVDEQGDIRRDGKTGGMRKPSVQSSSNATRDSQLLSVLAARRRQLLNGRLATHINRIATLAQKSNATFAQLEVRDSNGSVIRSITFDNSSNELLPTLKLESHEGSKVLKQDVKPHEIRHLFVPRVYQDNKTRAGFINNRKNYPNNKTIESGIVYVPPEKLDNLDKEVDLEPDEEFQVDESNHGLYLLNYSDTENHTIPSNITKDLMFTTLEPKDNSSVNPETTTFIINVSDENATVSSDIEEKFPIVIEKTESKNNSTNGKTNKVIKLESEKSNNTLFMTEEIYNHFRPLESELPAEDMAPFIYFGQKIGGQVISDNLTNYPSLSASTKSVNFISSPEKKKYNSRYSATEKYKNTSTDEDEINEDMDVSVVKNIIEKNKVRSSVKGQALTRQVSLVNAYRKTSSPTSTTTTAPSFALLNTSEPIVPSMMSNNINRSKENNGTGNFTNIISKDILSLINATEATKDLPNRTNVISPRNFTRNYHNIRRRPSKLTSLVSTENVILPSIELNTTTEKTATSVYTAVVTSISITSSMKGQNKTDSGINESDNSTTTEETNSLVATPKSILLNETAVTTTPLTTISTTRASKHRIRIRTTTTESSLNIGSSLNKNMDRPASGVVLPKTLPDLQKEATSRIPEKIANSFRQNVYESTTSTLRPKNILRRRRPTTSATSTTTSSPTSYTLSPLIYTTSSTTLKLPETTFPTLETSETTEKSFVPFVVTSKTSSESRSKGFKVHKNGNDTENSHTNSTNKNESENSGASQNEEVVIEAEKNYTTSYVLAGLGFLPVLAIIAFVLRNILNKKTKELDTEYEGYFEEGDIKKESQITPVARPPIPTPSKLDSKWEFPRSKLRLQTILGQGNFGQVWKAEADDLNGHDGLTRLVAVKSIKESATQKEKQELLHEIYIMQKIGTHPNVVTILACCTEQEPYLLIMEYVMCGKLLTYLRERRSRPDRFSGSGALTSRDLTVFAYCIARGMEYIASKGIIHRDLAARNVLVDHNKLCKIADFGMSRTVGASSSGANVGSRAALPVRWTPPEALLYGAYSTSSDVWSFGILLWEIVTLGSTPYAPMTGREVVTSVTGGYRLERPPHCSTQLYTCMESCWNADPTQRPTISTVKRQLADLLDTVPPTGNYVDLDSFYQDSSVYSDPSAIIRDDDRLSQEYDAQTNRFTQINSTAKYDNRGFAFTEEETRSKFGNTPRMGGFGIRELPFDRNFSDGDFNERPFLERNFADSNFNERSFNERTFSDSFSDQRKEKLSTASFHREKEREKDRDRDNSVASRNSFNGFPRVVNNRDGHFQFMTDGRSKRVPEFECDI